MFRLYRKIYEKAYGAASGEQMLLDLDGAIKKYNKEQGMQCAKMSVQDSKVIIAVCTPLMQRILTKHPNSAELVFVDSSGGMDRYNCRVFLLLTHSVAGGLPIGCLITTSETKETITSALNLYKEIVPLGAFYGRGQQGPAVFMTDDSDAEQQSLKATFPGATCLLCTFHVLQALWRYLWDSKQAIKREDRPYLLGLVKDMMYSKCEVELQALYATLCADGIARQYKNYLGYAAKLYNRRSEWAICLRDNLPVRGNNTNNYVEAAMRVLKDQIFERVRAYSPVQLLDFILIRMTGYYERRLTDLANGRLDVMVSKRYLPDHGKITPEMICRVSDTSQMYQVQSESNASHTYDVDMVHGMCTCPVGLNGSPCKHQYAVMKHCQVNSHNFFPLADEKMRQHLFYLASGLGNEYVPDEWFRPLRAGNRPHNDLNQDDDIDPTVNLQGSTSDETTTSMTRSSAIESLGLQRHFQNMFDRRNCAGACGSTGNDVEDGRVTNADTAAVLDGVQSVADKLKDIVKLNPEEMIGPAKVFIRQFNTLKSNAAVVSALQTFGKYTGAAEKLSQRKRRKMSLLNNDRLRCRRGKMIKVQPTAVSRRKTPLGGRRCLQTGRQPRQSASKCMLNKQSMCILAVKRRPRKAPHNLSRCVENNQTIGKSHSSKW